MKYVSLKPSEVEFWEKVSSTSLTMQLAQALEACEQVIGMASLHGKLDNSTFSETNEALLLARRALDKLRV